jgi:hypothetical protein
MTSTNRVNFSNRENQSAVIEIGPGTNQGVITFGYSDDPTPGKFISLGTGMAVSRELFDITGANTLGADETVSILAKLLTSEGERGGPDGVDGVELVGLTLDAATLSFTNTSGNTDTVVFSFGGGDASLEGLLAERNDGGRKLVAQNAGDAVSTYAVVESGETIVGTSFIKKASGGEYDVGGFIGGEKDTATILEAALDDDFGAVALVSLASDTFTVTISRGAATDTYTFTGENAEAALQGLEDGSNGIVNPGNKADQFVFVEAGDTGTVGIGFANRFDGVFGGVLSVDDLVEFVEEGRSASGVTLTRLGEDVVFEFDGNDGTTDTVVLSGDLLA